ncbi:hypothetical protein BDR26DRAFT_860497 [Obelidium mucronatum]|nr:hypothetical protein BDR26DRAFT_860497 [Obelidium mucronatum]
MTSPFAAEIASDLAATLTHIVYELDIKVVAVQSSQAELIKEMDHLASELHSLLAASDPPPIDPVLQRLLVCRKRLLAVNASLKSSQDRLRRISSLLLKN